MVLFSKSPAAKSIYDETAFHMEACEHYVYYQIEENSIKCDCESACRLVYDEAFPCIF